MKTLTKREFTEKRGVSPLLLTDKQVRCCEHDDYDGDTIDREPIEPLEDPSCPPGMGVQGLSGVYFNLFRVGKLYRQK